MDMVRWYYRSIFDELDELRKYLDTLYREASEGSTTALLPAGSGSATKILPVTLSRPGVDVVQHDDEVVVTADLAPGVFKKDITLDLIDPRALEISWERKEEEKEEKEGYYLRERRFGSMTRIIPLPVAVTQENASATVKNGVLEIHLKKSAKEPTAKIAIE
jgi:HSP20 family protein